jgi:hypothetical protein
MSMRFLECLNGNNNGYFKKWLNNFQNITPNISWYPSSGFDFRNLLYLSKQYAENNISQPKWIIPDLHIHTDFYKPDFDTLFPRNMVRNFTKPLSEIESLFREYADLSGWYLFNDGRTSVRVAQLEILNPIELSCHDLKNQKELVTLEVDNHNFRTAYYLKLDIGSDKYGHFESHLIYVNIVNETFANMLIENNAELSHISHVRYGSAFGGARGLGSFLINILSRLKTKYYLSDPHMDNESDVLPGIIYSNLKKQNNDVALLPIYHIKSESWSNNGDISFYEVQNISLN